MNEKVDKIVNELDPNKRYCPRCEKYLDTDKFITKYIKYCYKCCDPALQMCFG